MKEERERDEKLRILNNTEKIACPSGWRRTAEVSAGQSVREKPAWRSNARDLE